MACQTKNTKDYGEEQEEKPAAVLDEGDIALLKSYGLGPYSAAIKKAEQEIKEHQDKVITI
jgi:26S proteasome regulatory subunit T1